jgi:hypothetical protein
MELWWGDWYNSRDTNNLGEGGVVCWGTVGTYEETIVRRAIALALQPRPHTWFAIADRQARCCMFGCSCTCSCPASSLHHALVSMPHVKCMQLENNRKRSIRISIERLSVGSLCYK